MERVTHLVFEWPHFLRRVVEADAEIEGRTLHLHTAKSVLEEVPYLLFRVWFFSPAGMTMYVGDARLGPVTVWQASYNRLIRASDLAASKTLALHWAEIPDVEQDPIAPTVVIP